MRITWSELARRASAIRMLLLDVDGTLTDGGIVYTGSDQLTVSFEIKDGLGIQLAKKAGIEVAILTGRSSRALERRMTELGVERLVTERSDKGPAFREILDDAGLEAHEVAYVGDDLTDLPVLLRCGLAFSPRDGVQEVRQAAHRVLSRDGGAGCVREAVEVLLRARGQWDELLAPYYE